MKAPLSAMSLRRYWVPVAAMNWQDATGNSFPAGASASTSSHSCRARSLNRPFLVLYDGCQPRFQCHLTGAGSRFRRIERNNLGKWSYSRMVQGQIPRVARNDTMRKLKPAKQKSHALGVTAFFTALRLKSSPSLSSSFYPRSSRPAPRIGVSAL